MEQGQTPIMVLDRTAAAAMTGPAAMDAIGPSEGWESYWKDVDRKRRGNASWARTAA
jgi:hypothetical protein